MVGAFAVSVVILWYERDVIRFIFASSESVRNPTVTVNIRPSLLYGMQATIQNSLESLTYSHA